MKIIRIPTYWTAEQADTIHEFLGELRAAVWQEYHEDIKQLYQDVHKQAQEHIDNDFDGDVKF
jgi:hypothetical protein